MSADWLRELRAAAHSDWQAGVRYPESLSFGRVSRYHVRMWSAKDAQLAALAPDLAELLADFADDLEAQIDAAPPTVRPHMQGAAELLARLSALNPSRQEPS